MTQIAVQHPCKPAKRSVLELFARAVALMRQRRDLARLDDHALDDIGISRSDALAEARRHVWDAPDFWQK